MAKALIAHLGAWYLPGPAGGKGELRADGGYMLELQRMYADLQARCRGQPMAVEVEIRPVRDRRTLDQNRLMWALLTKMARAYGNTTPEACYLDMLTDFDGGNVDLWRVPVAALPTLRRAYRVAQVVEMLDGGMCIVRIGLGSSTFDRGQMREFIDRIFDRLAEMGVDDPETTQQYRDWRAAQDG